MHHLHDLLVDHREELIRRWSHEVKGSLNGAGVTRAELLEGMPRFIAEVAGALRRAAVGPEQEAQLATEAAEDHGRQRLEQGFDVVEVVREYGLFRDCVFQLVADQGVSLGIEEQRVLSRLTNDAAAQALAEYVRQRDEELRHATANHIAFLAHELRNPLGSAILAFALMRGAGQATEGKLAAMLDRNLGRLHRLIDEVLVHARLNAGVEPRREHVALTALLVEAWQESSADAEAKGVETRVEADDGVIVNVDRRILGSGLMNLVRNAVKFTHPGKEVLVRGHVLPECLRIEVEDRCGGLADGTADRMFDPFVQVGDDKSGFGLGLAIARQAAEAHGGTLRVTNLPGTGCVLVLDLPPGVVVSKT